MNLRVCAGLAVLALLSVAPAQAVETQTYLKALQDRARTLNLAQTRDWQSLLHYEPDRLGTGVTSTAVTDWFFLSPEGRRDPQRELDATLAAFFRGDDLKPRDEPAQCVFTARYHWLKSQLDFDPARLAEQVCARFNSWHDALDVGAATMVFPAAYLNSPASMFGHTLLRLDARRQTKQTELLAYAVNFAAETDEDNGLLFAVRGLSGGYAGIFGVYPYYEKVKEYARIESRDLWEYPLGLTPAEIERLLQHLWELRGVDFDYYFLKYNCSYQLLALIEAARPQLDLLGGFRVWAIPTDTLRALGETPGVVSEPGYRPALRTQLATETSVLSPEQTRLVLALAQQDVTTEDAAIVSQPAQARARILQAAHDFLYYQHLSGRQPRETALPHARQILLARSRVGGSADFPPTAKPDTAPDRGHQTRRFAAAVVSEDGEQSLRLRLRPAYHDLLDQADGYSPGSQINFLDVGIAASADGDAKLEYLRAIDIVSIAPRDRYFKPISWRFNTGLRRPFAPLFAADAPGLGVYLEGGPGLAWGSTRALGYVHALAALDLNHDLVHRHSAGLGGSAGLLLRPTSQWGVLMELGTIDRRWGAEEQESWASLGQQWHFSREFGLRLELERRDTESRDWSSLSLSGQWYF